MKVLNSIVFSILFIGALCSNALHAWAHYGAILHDPKTGHIVRLLGDRHADDINHGPEREFMKNIVTGLNTYLSTKASEVFVLEGMNTEDEKTMTQMLPQMLGDARFNAPLLGRLCLVVCKNKIKIDKIIFNDEFSFCEQPRILLMNFDIRSSELYALMLAVVELRATLKAYEKLNYDVQLRTEFSVKLRAEFKKFKHEFELFSKAGSHQFDVIFTCDYEKQFDTLLNEYIHNIFGDGQNNWLDNVEHVLNFDFVVDDSAPKKQNVAYDVLVDLFGIISQHIADIGFLSCIGKARLVKQNITLYTGSDHSKALLEHLKKMGYEVLWQQEYDMKMPLSKEDCEAFFAIKSLPKSKL